MTDGRRLCATLGAGVVSVQLGQETSELGKCGKIKGVS